MKGVETPNERSGLPHPSSPRLVIEHRLGDTDDIASDGWLSVLNPDAQVLEPAISTARHQKIVRDAVAPSSEPPRTTAAV
jgi:hypothetical protein